MLGFLRFLRDTYREILHSILMVPLPPPSQMSPVMAVIFFPEQTERTTGLKLPIPFGHPKPFKTFDSAHIISTMRSCGDDCTNLRIAQMRYYQRKAAPLHEFVLVDYEDTQTPGVKNFMVLERFGSKTKVDDPRTPESADSSSESSADKLGASADELEAFADEADSDEPESIVDEAGEFAPRLPMSRAAVISAGISLGVAHSAMALSKKDIRSAADDRVLISLRRDELDLAKMEDDSTLLATMTPPGDCTISVAQLIWIADYVSSHCPVYDLFESSCFYYGRAIFDVMRETMKCKANDVVTTDEARHMKTDALLWRLNPIHLSQSKMAAKAKAQYAPKRVRKVFDREFAVFLQAVRDKKTDLNRPLREAEEAREQAEERAEAERQAREQAEERANAFAEENARLRALLSAHAPATA
ncbi:hypothetical protein MKEN_01252400 [Mycena kentingensis (nom. inval.)]|nr:hypothetical protein MKEN_01252400 [Mycena kentingensis (nom. inval.)]